MGRRSRKRNAEGAGLPPLQAPEDVLALPGGDELVLRGVLTARTRQQLARAADPTTSTAAASREDVHHRRLELLFERLAVRWTIAGVATEGDKALLQRFRAASREERDAVRDALRRHCAEWFPDVDVP